MSGGSHFVWTPLLLFCIFQPSDNRYVHHDETTFIRRTGNPEVDDILSKIPITLPEGIDPKNVNVTSITIRTCTGMKEHLALLNTQLQQTRLRNSQLDEEAFGLRRDVRLLNLQLATCSSTASAITDSYQIQLHNKMQELLNKLGSDTSLMLTISTLTREVNTLEKRIKLAANSSETTTDLRALQSELQQKITELTAKQQQIAKSHTNSALILQIISLQNQIWDLQQEESRRGETSLQHEQRIKALQEQLDGKISELQRREDASSAMLHLISVSNKIAVIERYISVYTGRSRTDGSDYQRQLKQKGDLLKKKIMLLNRDEKNSNLTREILILQAEMDHFRQLISNAQGITTSRLTELRAMLEEAKKQQANLEKQLEETDYIQAQRIINIIAIMKEIRHLQGDKQQQTTPTSPASSLEALLKDKERQYAKAQADIKELERRLQVNNEECSGLEKQYTQVKTELEQKIADLSNGDSKASLILNVVNLYDELKTLKYLISITQDPQSVTELQRQLEKKQAELNSKKAEIRKQIGNPKIVLTVIELQNEIWDLQNKGTNGTTSNRLKELQARVDGLISEIDDRGDENTNLMLRIMTLQNQVNQLQKQLSDLQVSQTAQVNQLRTDLTVKKKELQDYINELHEKNQTNSRLILTITNLQNQLRNLEEERRNDSNISSLTITQLRKQLMARKAVQSHDQAEIKTLKNLLQAEERAHAFAQANIRDLQRKLQLKIEECSGLEERYTHVKTELEQKIAELKRRGDSKAALILNVINLHEELRTLKNQILTTEDPETLAELRRQLEEKQTELNSKKAEIQKQIGNPKIVLTVIELQNEIWDLQNKGTNGTTSNRLKELQARVDGLISEIDDRGDENTNLMLRIMTLQNQVNQLQKQLSDLQVSQTAQVNQLRTDLTVKKKELQDYINELHEKNQTNSRLILTITNLQNQLRNLEEERRNDSNISSLTITQLRKQLMARKAVQSHDQAEIKTLKNLLQAEERAHAFAQANIRDLQRKLQLKIEECSGLEERYTHVKTELEQKIAELKRRGDSKAALILNVINLHEELRTLKNQILTTEDPETLAELRRQLEEKQTELNSKKAEIQKQIGNPKIVLTVIELQNEIWDLQNKGTNGTTSNRLKELQARVDGLISEIDDRGDENTNLMLRIMTLQNQVNQLQKQLSDLQVSQTAQVNQLRTDLTVKKKELQDYINELHGKNQTNSRLILTITNLQNQLRNLEEERRNDSNISSLTITQLRKQLMARKVVQSHDQAEIKTLKNLLQAEERAHAFAQANIRDLQRKLQLKIEECSGLEERYTHVKTELEQKIAELKRRGDSKAALILNVINLHEELRTLKNQILTTEDPETLAELRRQLEEKQTELDSENADIERQIGNPKIILTIIELQNEIWDLQNKGTNGTTSNHIKELQTRVDGLIADISDKGNENTKLMLRIMTLQSQVERLQKQLSDLRKVKTPQVTQLENDLNTKKNELQRYINELNEKNQANAELILTITNLNNQLRKVQEEKHKEGQKTSATITELREQLQIKTEEHSRDQDTIKALQNKLNQTEAQCSGYEHRITELQSDLDEKMKRLQSESDSVTTLALQVSTLTLQLEELKKQLENTDSKNKIRELQMQIDEKNKELAKKTEELNARSAQPQRLLQIITIQTEIEKFANAAVNETDYNKIRALQEQINNLVEGIQDEKTKLVYQVLTRQDEVARLKKQEESQRQALLDNIKDLENQLEEVRHEITEKTQVLDSSDMRITNLSAQIMELHKKIKPLEDEISYLKETHAENEADLQRRLDLTKRQLQDSELRLKEADTKNFNSIMEIADLRAQLKKAQRQASKADKKNINELEEQLQTQQRANRKLENTNRDLQQEVKELKKCCNDNTHCEDLQRQLQQSQEDADRLQQQLTEKEADFKQLQQDLKEQTRENERLRNENSNLKRQLSQNEDNADLQQQLQRKDSLINQLQQELDEQTATNQKLQDDYNNLQNERNNLEERVQALQNKLSDVEDKTIYARRMTLDPNTAHPRIILSADDSEMSTTEDIQNVPDNPSRFDVVLAVLGKTGFSTGRNYWEVSVAGKQCYHLGMASESAPRKGSITFNPRKGFWTIVLNKQGEYRAVDRTSVAIKVTTQPITLGILLDYKKGQISFYDAGARSHMYTFAGQTFTDRIYPFINYCVEDGPQTPIVLVAPGTVDWIK